MESAGGIQLSGHPIVRPTENATFATDVIGMPHNDDVRVERLQGMFRPPRRHIHCLGYLKTK